MMSLKEAARHIWESQGIGHAAEFYHHWDFQDNYKKTNPLIWAATIYPKLVRNASLYRMLHFWKSDSRESGG